MKKIDHDAIKQMDPSIFPPQLIGKLDFRPFAPTEDRLPPGEHMLGLAEGEERDTLLIVPEELPTDQPVPLMVMFHGASGSADKVVPFFAEHARRHQFLLMLPQSTLITWDLTLAGHGPDLYRLNRALKKVFTHFEIDLSRFALAGFSDGASYALSTGLTNGDLISHIIVLSGGFMNVYMKTGKPLVFIAHSPEDEQLNIRTSAIKHYKALKDENYDVTFELFTGKHVIHPPVVEKAVSFFLERKRAES